MPVRVSVIVPVYNPGPYIEDCIASMLRQSLPSDEYEVIFVDDGSTDGTGARLDTVATQHDNITAIHIPNSGWPGRPRNVGIDAAVGKYVYFVDNDDWIGDEALEHLDARAERNEADVVIGKEVSHGKGVPRELFRHNIDDVALDFPPLLLLLTPHKLFRRSFLDEHAIRFPEGRRRLEDHVFVMKAYFAARRISILADYPCYHWVKRDDAGNATDRRAEPVAHYANLREVLDIVDDHTAPGAERDRLYAHWYRSKALYRLRGPGWANSPSAYGLEVYGEIRRLALERFGPGVDRALPAKFRVMSASVRADRMDLVTGQARIERGIRAEVSLGSVEWMDWRLRLSLRAGLAYADGTAIALERRAGRVFWRPPAPLADDPAIPDAALDVTADAARTTVAVVLRNRESKVEHDALATIRQPIGADGSSESFTLDTVADADIDLTMMAAGSRLDIGVWDLFVEVQSCGWRAIRRLSGIGRTEAEQRPVAEPYTTEYGNVSVRVRDAAEEQRTAERDAARRALAQNATTPKAAAKAAPIRRYVPGGIVRLARPMVRALHRWRNGG